MESRRTYFNLLQIDDYPELLEMYQEKDTFKFIEPLQGLSIEEHILKLEKRRAQIDEGTGYHWICRNKQDHNLVGMMNLNQVPGSTGMYLGYQIKRHLWGQGYGTELASKVLEFAFADADLDEVYALIEAPNIASRKILLRMGFTLFKSKVEGESTLETYVLKKL